MYETINYQFVLSVITAQLLKNFATATEQKVRLTDITPFICKKLYISRRHLLRHNFPAEGCIRGSN